jgi:hypothetical protein
MKKVLLVAFAAMFVVSGSAWAGDACEGCSPITVGGYIGPNFRMIDQGDSQYVDDNGDPIANVSDLGFGLAFARFNLSGLYTLDNKIVKKVGWKYETDIREPGVQGLVYAYVDAYFNDQFMVRFGRQKEVFSREWLHATGRLLTVDRHIYAGMLGGLSYAGYSYGLTAFYKHEMFNLMGGVYDGQGANSWVGNQDAALDFAFRATANPTPCLEIGANVAMKSLPGMFDGTMWDLELDDSEYPDDPDYYQTNSGMAYGADLEYKKSFQGDMSLWAQAEFGMGDNYMLAPKDPEAEDTWEDYEWYSFQYFYVKALFMATKFFGLHAGFSSWDPNTDGDVGENNSTTQITPGITLVWSDMVRTQIEVQLVTEQNGVDAEGENLDDCTYTHFVLQQVVNW